MIFECLAMSDSLHVFSYFSQPLKSNKKVGSSEDEIEGALCSFCIFCIKSGPHYDQACCLERRGLVGLDSPSRTPYKRPLPPLNVPRGTEDFEMKMLPLDLNISTVRISRSFLEKNTKHREGWKLGRRKKASTLQTIFFSVSDTENLTLCTQVQSPCLPFVTLEPPAKGRQIVICKDYGYFICNGHRLFCFSPQNTCVPLSCGFSEIYRAT